MAAATASPNNGNVPRYIEPMRIMNNYMTPGSEAMNLKLIQAAQYGDTAEVARLIRAGANVNSKDRSGHTPLWLAIIGSHVPVVEQLLAAPGIDVNINSEHTTPLQIAIIYNHELALRLLDIPAIDVNKAPDGNPPILNVARDRSLPLLEKILSKPDVNVNVKSRGGDFSALITATLDMQYATVERLLMHPAIDVNITANYGAGSTPLMIATNMADERMVNLLLTHPRIDVNYTNAEGKSAVSLAMEGSKFSRGDRKLRYANILSKLLARKAWNRRSAAVMAWARAKENENQGGGACRYKKNRTHKRNHRKLQSRRRRM